MIQSTEYQKGSFRHKSSTPTHDELHIYPSNKLHNFKQNPGKLYFSALQGAEISPSQKGNKLRSREQRKSVVDYPPKARWPNSSSEKDTSEHLGLTTENSKGPLETRATSKTPIKGDQILRASYLKARVDRRFNSSDYSISSKENLIKESPKHYLSGLSTQDPNVRPPPKFAHKIHLHNEPLNTSGINLSTLNEGLNTSMGHIQTKPNSTTNTQPDYIFTKAGVKQRKRPEQGPIRAEHSFELGRITSPQEALGIMGIRDNSRHARISRLKKAFGNSPVLGEMKEEFATQYSNSSKKDSRTVIGVPKAQEELRKKRSNTMEKFMEGTGYESEKEKERKSIRRKESNERDAVIFPPQREKSRESDIGNKKVSAGGGKHMPQVITEQRVKNVLKEVREPSYGEKRRETPKSVVVKEEKRGMGGVNGVSFSALINNDGDLNLGDMVNIEEMHYSFVKFHQRTKQIMARIKQAC